MTEEKFIPKDRELGSPNEEMASQLMYKAAYKSAKETGIISEDTSLEDFMNMPMGEVFEKLKEKGVDKFEIQL